MNIGKKINFVNLNQLEIYTLIFVIKCRIHKKSFIFCKVFLKIIFKEFSGDENIFRE